MDYNGTCQMRKVTRTITGVYIVDRTLVLVTHGNMLRNAGGPVDQFDQQFIADLDSAKTSIDKTATFYFDSKKAGDIHTPRYGRISMPAKIEEIRHKGRKVYPIQQ